jgi:hypothetical protein
MKKKWGNRRDYATGVFAGSSIFRQEMVPF